MTGTCACGCGTPVRQGRTYVLYHHLARVHDSMRGEAGDRWKGGRLRHNEGYVMVYAPGHPRATNGPYAYEHILIAEGAVGRPLLPGAQVHHVNGVRDDNRPQNLVICEDQRYHALLHQRQRALAASGHADWRICNMCHQYDDPANLYISPGDSAAHRACLARRMRDYNAKVRSGYKPTPRTKKAP